MEQIDVKKFEDIAEKASVYYNEVDRALAVVRDYIRNKDRILYGGMAIDLSLKLSGHKGIYADDAIPDFDFMSPEYYNDSNELANILFDKKFDNVSAIHAIHLTSRRVRVNFIPVADITYIPRNIYEQIPTLVIPDGILKDIRIVHPDFQRLDMYRAICTPFEKPPGEVILQRTRKDMKRFRMLNTQYPIVTPKLEIPATTKLVIPKKYLDGLVIGGSIAYGMFCKLSGMGCMNLDIDKKNITLQYPLGWNILANIITDDFSTIVDILENDTGKTAVYKNKYLDDLRPRTIIVDRYEIYDNYGRKLPVFDCNKVLSSWGLEGDMTNILICQAHYVLLYFLLKFYETSEPMWIWLHNSMFEIISHMEREPPNVEYSDIPFYITAKTYGEKNWSPDYILSVKEKIHMLDGKKVLLRGPFGFYPNGSGAPDTDLSFLNTELFLIDSVERTDKFPTISDYFVSG
jgi:hypothetical protein